MKRFSVGIAIIALVSLSGCSGSNLQQDASSWASSMRPGWEFVGMSSRGVDTDGDGKVTVDVSLKNPQTQSIENFTLDCGAFSHNSGCTTKLPTMGQ